MKLHLLLIAVGVAMAMFTESTTALCNGDANADSGCGVNCNKLCSDLNKEPGFCIQICKENGCDCKPGFYYKEQTKKCVLPANC